MRQMLNQSVVLGWRQNRVMLLTGLAVFFMVIMAALPAPVQADSKITQILVSDKADADGVVTKHQDKFAPTTASIKGTALISGMEKGQKVTTDLIYGPRTSKPFPPPMISLAAEKSPSIPIQQTHQQLAARQL